MIIRFLLSCGLPAINLLSNLKHNGLRGSMIEGDAKKTTGLLVKSKQGGNGTIQSSVIFLFFASAVDGMINYYSKGGLLPRIDID